MICLIITWDQLMQKISLSYILTASRLSYATFSVEQER